MIFKLGSDLFYRFLYFIHIVFGSPVENPNSVLEQDCFSGQAGSDFFHPDGKVPEVARFPDYSQTPNLFPVFI